MSEHRPVPPDSAPDEASVLRRTGAAPLHRGDPRRIGPYVPLALLGSGGMGRVYLARAEDGGPELVAVKVIRPEYADDPGFRRRFEREASVHDLVRTPRTPRLCGTGFADELLWMATEYLPGLDLADAVREDGALASGAVWRLVAELGQALADLSTAGIVHRDLKPSNVLLSVRGAHVIDFGLSKAVDASALTGTGNRVGTPAYMSPEHLRTGTCDTASDVFSLAGTLVYAATGHAPFGDGTGVDVMHRVAFEEPSAELLGEVAAADPELAALLSACLAKEPERRPTPRELSDAAAPHAEMTGWPEPLAGRVLARQRAYEALGRLPVDSASRLRTSADPPPTDEPAPPAPGLMAGNTAAPAHAPGPVAGQNVPPTHAPMSVTEQSAPPPPGRVAEHTAPPAPGPVAGQNVPPAHAPMSVTEQSAPPPPRRVTEQTAPPPPGSPEEPTAVRKARSRAVRKPLLAVAAGVVLCVAAAGVLALDRDQNHSASAAPPGSGTSLVGTLPGGAVASASRAADARSASGKSVDGGADRTAESPTPSGASHTAGDARPGEPSAAPSASAPVPTAGGATSEPASGGTSEPASAPWNSDCTYYNGNGRTGEGDSGKKVLQVQCMLTKRGYDIGSSGVDGEFGAGTESAVERFQSDKGLSVDGVVAHDTWTALRETD